MNSNVLSYMVCGKFMYPQPLVELRRRAEFSDISSGQIREAELLSLRELVQHQLEAGLTIVSDGCIMRERWDYDFYFGLGGVERRHVRSGHIYEDCELSNATPSIAGPIVYDAAHPLFAQYASLCSLLPPGVMASVLLPAPAHFLLWLLTEDISWKSVYSDSMTLVDDISRAYRQIIIRFYELGCRHVILEDHSWQTLCRRDDIKRIIQSGLDPHQLVSIFRIVNDKSVEDMPSDLDVMLYLKRLEPDMTHAIASAHCDFISSMAFDHANVPTVILDMPDGQADSIERMAAHLPEGKSLVLGVVDGRSPQLESMEDIQSKIMRMRRVIGDRLRALTVIGGFKRDTGSISTTGFEEEDQWHKIGLLRKVSQAMA